MIRLGNARAINDSSLRRHCEERSDEAIQKNMLQHWIASLAPAMTS
jgi:hypothetical protein